MKNSTLAISRRCLTRGAIILLIASAPTVHAAEWRLEPVISVGYEADDNAALDPITAQEADIDGLLLEGRARIGYVSERSEFFLTPRVLSRDYGEPLFDTDDQFLDLQLDKRGRFARFGLDASYERELVRTAERLDTDFDITDPDDIPVDASTRVDIRDRRERVEVHPDFSYQLSEVSTFGADVRYTDVTYDENLAGLLNDYTNLRGNLTYRRDWSRRNTAVLQGTYRRYEAEMREAVTGIGAMAGFETRISETTRFRAMVGVEDTELDTGQNDTNWVANLSLSRRLQTITMLAQYRRVIAGGGGGTLTARDMLNLNFKRDLSDRVSAGLGLRAYTTSALEEGAITIDERDYLQLRAQFVWRLTQTLDVEVNYRYSILNREFIGESANSNNVTMFFNWRPRGIGRSE